MEYRRVRGGYKLVFKDETEFKDVVNMFEKIKTYIKTQLDKDEDEFFCFNKATSDLLRLYREEKETDEDGNEKEIVSSAIFENMFLNFFEMAFISCAFLQGKIEYMEILEELKDSQDKNIELKDSLINAKEKTINIFEAIINIYKNTFKEYIKEYNLPEDEIAEKINSQVNELKQKEADKNEEQC